MKKNYFEFKINNTGNSMEIFGIVLAYFGFLFLYGISVAHEGLLFPNIFMIMTWTGIFLYFRGKRK